MQAISMFVYKENMAKGEWKIVSLKEEIELIKCKCKNKSKSINHYSAVIYL